MTAGQKRTAAARAKAVRNAEDRAARKLRGRGWACIPPETLARLPEAYRTLIGALNESTPPAT